MIKKIKTIRRIKNLKNSRLDDVFLHSFRADLQKFMAANPVMEKDGERLSIYEELNSIINNFYKINQTKFMPIAIVIALITMLSGGGAALASQNSLPGEALYPVKTLTEDVRSALTINKQSEAKLQSKLAAERLEEVSKMLQANNVDSQGVEIALSKLKDHVAKMSQIVEEEKTKGNDVAQLENDLSENLKTNKEVLERTFKQHKENLESEKKGLEKEIDVAEKNNSDENTINALKTKLDTLKQKRESFENKEHSIKREIKDNDDEDEEEDEDDEDEEEEDERETRSYDTIELKLSALKAMREAEKEKNGLLVKASSTNVIIADKYFKQYDDFMAKASSSLAIGGSMSTSTATSIDLSAANYKQAYQFAKQAKEMLELAEKEYERQNETLKKKEERSREMKKQEEERERESNKQEAEKNQDKNEDLEDEDRR